MAQLYKKSKTKGSINGLTNQIVSGAMGH